MFSVFVLTKEKYYVPPRLRERVRVSRRIFFAEGLTDEDLEYLAGDPKIKDFSISNWNVTEKK